ncbi:hypothetical protein BGZ83_011702, partial [Gryganskiella cystojenkinii]
IKIDHQQYFNARSFSYLTTNSIGLTLLGHVPGIVYAWYVIYKNRDDPNHLNRRNGRVYAPVPQQQNYQATAPAPVQ